MHSLNHIYRLVWNERLQRWQAVPETARGRGKQGRSRRAAGLLALAAAGLAALLPAGATAQTPPALDPRTLPTGARVVAGQAVVVVAPDAPRLTVQQASQRAVLNWDTFNLGAQAQIRFDQPSSSAVTLNRVLGGGASTLLGQISAPGQVFISNPDGVLFGRSARVDVGGLVATTHRIADADFMAGRLQFDRAGSTGAVVNQGELRSRLGGYIALLAPEVRNQGVVIAQAGTAALASGETITLRIEGDGRLASLQTTPSAIATLVENGHAVLAPDGLVILSATGANRLSAGVIRSSGTLDASSLQAVGGRIVLEGDEITLAAGSHTAATGATGGGTVHVGGGWQGSGPMTQARVVTMAEGASVDVSATREGSGGEAVLWSSLQAEGGLTRVAGSISARGAGQGDGGRVETSGAHLDTQPSTRVDTRDAKGGAGLWLLDPYDYLIAPTGGQLTGAQLDAALAGANISILTSNATAAGQAGASTAGPGDIVVSDSITIPSGRTLTLNAGGGISGSGSIANSGTLVLTQAGNSTLSSAISGTGGVTVNGAGTLTLAGLSTYSGLTTITNSRVRLGAASVATSSAAITSGPLGVGNIHFTDGQSGFLDLNGYDVYNNIAAQAGRFTLQNLAAGTTATYAGSWVDARREIYLQVGGESTLRHTGTIDVVTQNAPYLDMSGSGTIELAGSSYNAGGFLVRSGIVFRTASAAVLQRTNIQVQVFSGGTLDVNGISTSLGNGPIFRFSGAGRGGLGALVNSASGTTVTLCCNHNWDGAYSIGGSGNLLLTGNTQTGTTSASTVTWAGSGTLRWDMNPFSGGSATFVVNQGTLAVDRAVSSVNLATGTTLAFLGAGPTSFSTAVSGSGQILRNGTGTVTLSGAVTSTGGITINSGGLDLGNNVPAPTTPLVVNGTLTFNNASAQTVANNISGTGGIIKNGAGTLTLSGNNSYSGSTTVNAGTVELGHANALGSSAGSTTVANGATVSIAGGLTVNERFIITGTGVGGNGALRVSGADNALTGDISSTGTLNLDAGSSLTLSGAATHTGWTTIGAGSTLRVGNGTTGSLTSPVTNNGSLIYDTATSFTTSSTIGGSGTLTQQGSGTVTLGAGNSYTGATWVNAGTLVAGHSNSLGTTAAGTTVADGATLALQGVTGTMGEAITIHGNGVGNGGALRNLTSTATLSGTVTLGSASRIHSDAGTLIIDVASGSAISGSGMALTVGGAGNLTLADPLDLGTGSLVKEGTGSLRFNASSTYTGGTTINNGLVVLGTATTPMGTGLITVQNTGGIDLGGRQPWSDPVTASGLGPNGTGALQSSGGQASFYSGTLTPGGTTLGLGGNGGGQLRMNGVIADGPSGPLAVTTTGSVQFNADMTYTGGTTINAGSTLQLGLHGNVGGLVGNVVNNGTLDVFRANNLTLAGNISGTGNLITRGTSGALTLSGNNSYTGTTALQGAGGALRAVGATALGSSAAGTTMVANSRLELSGVGTLAEAISTAGVATITNVAGDNTLTSTLSVGGNTTFSLTGGLLTLAPTNGNPISGTNRSLLFTPNGGNMAINAPLSLGTGAVTLNSGTGGTVTFNSANSYSGGTVLNGGILEATVNGALGSGSVTIQSGGTLGLSGNVSVSSAVTMNPSSTLRNLGGNNSLSSTITGGGLATITSDAGTLALTNSTAVNGTHSLTLSGAGDMAIQGAIATGNGTVIKNGTGTATLSGASTYTGSTTINAGTLVAAHNAALGGTGGGTIVNSGGTLALQGGRTVGEGITLNGTGANGAGALRNLSGNNTITSQVSLGSNARINSDADLLTVDVASGNAISGTGRNVTFGGAGNTTVADPIATTTGTLTKDGPGTLTLLATNTYTGTTTISGGTLQLGNGGSTGSVAGAIVNDAALVINRGTATTMANNISGSGTLQQAGAGNVTLTGTLSYGGATTITGSGSLIVGGAINIPALSPAQVAALNSAQWATLTTAQIAQLSASQLAALTAQQISWLSSAQLGTLTGAQIGALTNTQLAALTAGQVGQMSTAQLAGLTASQLGLLSVAQLGALSTTQFGSLSASQLGGLTGAQVAALSAAQLGTLSGVQFAGLTPAQMAALTVSQWGTLNASQLANIGADQLGAIAPTTLAGFSGAQMAALGAAAMGGLNAAQLGALSPSQVAAFSAAQLAALATGLMPSLSTAQLSVLGVAQVAALSAAQLGALTPAQLAVLSGTQWAAFSPTQLAGLTLTQIASLSEATAAGFTGSQLALLSASQLAALSHNALAAISPSLLATLHPAQLASLSATQVDALSAAQIGALTPAQLAAFSTTQLGGLAPADLAGLSGSQLAALTGAQMATLSAPQIAALSVAQLQQLSPQQAQSLQAAQLDALSSVQRQAVLAVRIGTLSPEAIAQLPLAEVQQLTAGILSGLSVAQRAALTPAQVAALTPAALTTLDANQLAALSIGQLSQLNLAQVQALRAEQVVQLSVAQREALAGVRITAVSAQGPGVLAALPVVTGVASPGATVTVFSNGTQVGQVTASDTGAWTWRADGAFTVGTNQLGATAHRGVVGTSAAEPTSFEVALPAPVAPPASPPFVAPPVIAQPAASAGVQPPPAPLTTAPASPPEAAAPAPPAPAPSTPSSTPAAAAPTDAPAAPSALPAGPPATSAPPAGLAGVAPGNAAPASSAGGGSGADAPATSGSGSTAGVRVALVELPTTAAVGLVAITVPASTSTAGTGVVVALPVELNVPSTDVKVTLANGKPLPNWVRYSADDHTLVLGAVPDGSLPLQLLLQAGAIRATLQISEEKIR